MDTYLILDKSFLQGVKKQRIVALTEKYKIIMSTSLLYELIKGESEQRAHLFQKLPSFDVIQGLPTIFRYEMNERRPYGKPSSHIVERDYSNTKLLIDENFELSEKQMDALKYEAETVELLTQPFLDTPLYSHKDVKGNQSRYESLILNDTDFILDEYKKITLYPNVFKETKKPSIDATWATYKWLQIIHLFQLDIACRYPDIKIILDSKKALEKMKHDTLDQVYLLLAVLEGGFATKENKLKKFFNQLCSDGIYEC